MDSWQNTYDISENGFLPSETPLTMLPEYFEHWDDLVSDIPKNVSDGVFREKVKALTLLDANKLKNQREIQRAYSILSLISHSYIWGSHETQGVPTKLPKQLAVPLSIVSDKLGIHPILTHAAVDLYNWRLIDSNGEIELDNLRCIHTMTGKMDEEWFFLIMTDIEKKAGPVLHKLVEIKRLISENSNNQDRISVLLNEIKDIVDAMTKVMMRMGEKCDPSFFYNVLRPYVTGWTDKKLFPNGLLYESVSDEAKIYVGGSAAQSTIFQVLDSAFQIEHKNGYFSSIRNHMPGKHRAFIEFMDDLNISDYSEMNVELKVIYKKCIISLQKFRNGHMALVHKYILNFTKKKTESDSSPTKGSGDTPLEDFLKEAIDDTKRARS
jgi:indoleamine 2,3-dioxygenase